MQPYSIRPASTSDAPSLMALRAEAEKWLPSVGTDQWSDTQVGARAIEKWRQSIIEGRTWSIVNKAGEIAATVTRGPADLDFWHEEDQLETAFYLYKLIVARSASGKGLGALVLNWACQVAALEGRRWVRIDCWRTNSGLQRYYEGLGFQHVRTESPSHRKSGWLAQRSVEFLTPDAGHLLPSPRRFSSDAAPATSHAAG
jgi:GNAT superfamily N-acetyltransferase